VGLAVTSAATISPIVIHLGRLGDTILLDSLLRSLRHQYPNPCRLICARLCADVYRSYPDVDQIWRLDRHTPLLLSIGWWRVLWMLRHAGSAPVYVCETEPRRLSRIKRLLALSGIAPARCVFLDRHPVAPDTHWIDRWVSFGQLTPPALQNEARRPPAPNAACTPRLEILDSERVELNRWIRARGWGDRPLILVQPGNRRAMRLRRLRPAAEDSKAWPVTRWAALLQQVHSHMPEALIVLNGAPRESALLRKIRAATGLPAVVTATPPLRLLFALCDAAYGMISVDSGPAHAAAALGLPVVVLFGMHGQQQWLPRSASGAGVIGVGGPPIANRLDEIAVDTVFTAWLALLKQIPASRSVRPRSPATVTPVPTCAPRTA